MVVIIKLLEANGKGGGFFQAGFHGAGGDKRPAKAQNSDKCQKGQDAQTTAVMGELTGKLPVKIKPLSAVIFFADFSRNSYRSACSLPGKRAGWKQSGRTMPVNMATEAKLISMIPYMERSSRAKPAGAHRIKAMIR